MKRIITVAVLAIMAISLVACSQTTALTGDEDITMANIDNYLAADARFVDVRDFNDFITGGYIAGFEAVPFFQYLEGRALVRNNGWEFSSGDVTDPAILENVFGPKDDVIVLMCGSGARAGYLKEALESIGYESVINAGGIRDYSGENKIQGDSSFSGARAITGDVTMANIDSYLGRPGAKYVDLRNVADKYVGGYVDGFEVVSFFEYLDGRAWERSNGWEFSADDIIDPIVLENIFGSKSREVFLMCGSGTRAEYAKLALEAIGYEHVWNAGGIRDYQGNNKVFGDESFSLDG